MSNTLTWDELCSSHRQFIQPHFFQIYSLLRSLSCERSIQFDPDRQSALTNVALIFNQNPTPEILLHSYEKSIDEIFPTLTKLSFNPFWSELLKNVTSSFSTAFTYVKGLRGIPEELFGAVQGVFLALKAFPDEPCAERNQSDNLIECLSELNYSTGILAFHINQHKQAAEVAESFVKLTDFLAIMEKACALQNLLVVVEPRVFEFIEEIETCGLLNREG
jgi:hypothetical protein